MQIGEWSGASFLSGGVFDPQAVAGGAEEERHLAVNLVHHFLGRDVLELLGDILHFVGVVLEQLFQGDHGGAVLGEGLDVDLVEIPLAGGQEGAALLADGGFRGIESRRFESSFTHFFQFAAVR